MPSHLPHVGVALKFCLALMFFLGLYFLSYRLVGSWLSEVELCIRS
jgi:hypothetical protein